MTTKLCDLVFAISVLMMILPISSGTAIDDCFTEFQCAGARVPSISQVTECCVNRSDGMSYRLLGECTDCIVYGFMQERLLGVERGEVYSVQVGYIKRPSSITALIHGQITVVPNGTAALNGDFFISSTTFTLRPNDPEEIFVAFLVDYIAQEMNETAQLTLEPMTTLPTGSLARDTLILEIEDSDVVTFQLSENDYRSVEQEGRINAIIIKDFRIANPVTLQLTPHTVSQAAALGLITDDLPSDDLQNMNPLSPNRARTEPVDRRDFSPDVIIVRFESDEFGEQGTERSVSVEIFDDEIDEADIEVFIIGISLNESVDSRSGVSMSRASSLCLIADDDDIQIGFQNASYTFTEPQVESFTGTVLLEKQDGQLTEQTLLVVVTLNTTAPNSTFGPATIGSSGDFAVLSLDNQTTVTLQFPPEDQLLGFQFTIFPDNKTAEGLEGFQASISPSEISRAPTFSAPTPGVLYTSTFIVIVDPDKITVGFEQNYTVSEDVDLFEICFRVFQPTGESDELSSSFDLVVDTVAGTAGELDYNPIQSRNFGMLEIFNSIPRRACFNISIKRDNVVEDTETFFLFLSFDKSTPQRIRDVVTIKPAGTVVTIIDATLSGTVSTSDTVGTGATVDTDGTVSTGATINTDGTVSTDRTGATTNTDGTGSTGNIVSTDDAVNTDGTVSTGVIAAIITVGLLIVTTLIITGAILGGVYWIWKHKQKQVQNQVRRIEISSPMIPIQLKECPAYAVVNPKFEITDIDDVSLSSCSSEDHTYEVMHPA